MLGHMAPAQWCKKKTRLSKTLLKWQEKKACVWGTPSVKKPRTLNFKYLLPHEVLDPAGRLNICLG